MTPIKATKQSLLTLLILTTSVFHYGCSTNATLIPQAPEPQAVQQRAETANFLRPTTARSIYQPLINALESPAMGDPDYSHNTKAFQKVLSKMKRKHQSTHDFALGDIGVWLKKHVVFNQDPRVQEVTNTFNRVSRIYHLNRFDPSKPVLLFVHGAGRGAFSTFRFEPFEKDYNIAFFVYNHWDPLDSITRTFAHEWDILQKTVKPNQNIGIFAHSYGGIIVRQAVLTFGHSTNFKQANLIQLAVPLAGTRIAMLATNAPFYSTRFLWNIFAGHRVNIGWALAPLGKVMKESFSQASTDLLHARINTVHSIQVDGDIHNPDIVKDSRGHLFQNKWNRYIEQYTRGLGDSAITLTLEEEANPHGDAPRNAHYIQAMVKVLDSFMDTEVADL